MVVWMAVWTVVRWGKRGGCWAAWSAGDWADTMADWRAFLWAVVAVNEWVGEWVSE